MEAAKASAGADLVLRNGALLLAVLVCGLTPGARVLLWVDAITIGAAATSLALLHAAVELALARAPLRSGT